MMNRRRRGPLIASISTLNALVAIIMVASTASAASAAADARVSATFAPPSSFASHLGVTYDPVIVPVGSRVQVRERPNQWGGVVVDLNVWGLTPSTRFDAYVYTRPCGATPASAGKRTQDGPSTQHYPQNEVWLDFSTNARGSAHASDDQYWRFNPGQANSVQLLSPTTTRVLACVTVHFR